MVKDKVKDLKFVVTENLEKLIDMNDKLDTLY